MRNAPQSDGMVAPSRSVIFQKRSAGVHAVFFLFFLIFTFVLSHAIYLRLAPMGRGEATESDSQALTWASE